MSRAKIGILGAGFIAKVHVDNLKNDERVEIAGVGDLHLDKAKTLAKDAGTQTKAFSSLDELLESKLDAVYVTTPNTLHFEPVLKCLENNVNVFCEKPVATSFAGGRTNQRSQRQVKRNL
jgi:myo-inositol 2-dehydrogenase / D-chiro-inositol 1-dehydrogenase